MRALALVLLVSLAPIALAQLRTIPADAKVGVIRHLQEMQIEIDGKPQRLSPGAQIRDTDNRLVLPISLTEKQLMRYLVDAQGLVHRVWILSTQERAQAEKGLPKPKPKPKPKPPAEKKDAADKK